MHKITIGFQEGSHYGERGYTVKFDCDLVGDDKLFAVLKDPTDAVKFANWKATELGLTVELGYEIERVLNPKPQKKKKKEKK